MDLEEYEQIFCYLSDKKYPNDIKESEKRIRKMSYKFVIEGSDLFYLEKDKLSDNMVKRLVITKVFHLLSATKYLFRREICSFGIYFTENLFCRNFLNEKLVPGTFSTVLKMYHISNGHQGVNKTVTKINERYY